MNLAQLSDKLSSERVKQLESSTVWEAVVARGMSWQEAMLNHSAVTAAWDRLSSSAKGSLEAFMLLVGAAPVEEDKLLAALREHTALSGMEARMGLRDLQEAGIVLAAAKVWGERICFMPTDSFLLWHQLLFPCPLNEIAVPVQPLMDASGTFLGAQEPLSRRVLYMLSALVKSETAFTSKGILPKKTIQRLQEALRLEDGRLAHFAWSVARREAYPLSVAAGLAAAAAMGLLRREERGLNVDHEGLQRWSAMSDCDREEAMISWAFGYGLKGTREDVHIGAALASASAGKWYSASEVAEWGELLLHSSGAASKNGLMLDRVTRWLTFLHELGWMELAERLGALEGTGLLFRRREFSSAIDGRLIVQPTGELLVAPGSSLGMRWELELIAERIHREEPVLYRMTAHSVAAALEHGRTKEGVADFLAKASGEAELPIQLESMLEQWANRSSRYSFTEAMLLRCDTAELAEQAISLSGIAEHVLARIGEKDFIIDPAGVSELRGLLNKAGYPPRKGIVQALDDGGAGYPYIADFNETLGQTYTPLTPDRSFESAEWLYEPMTLRHYELDQTGGAAAVTILSGMDRVPTAWWRQLRSYHASTRKELIQQAVAMETAVQLNLDGKLRNFVPEQIELRGEQWAVTGKLIGDELAERSRLTPDMWEEMKLVLPSGIIM
ncbi:helicase-associated domain-containing protein [Paenibacillus paeoniae]|uniref:Helicase XPB/Ssl2 N-terminal domain-containing protein n=1 Tax=Paenibacillus paeoniae TaxID=2292705 RepID=A0A371PJP8_9BACL|nr:helicase-associated domain-containing protein [Paenibacillus paeoniae]REK76373.1 hypothetical protein DX130_04840 [Paenibacillus paeoniae]